MELIHARAFISQHFATYYLIGWRSFAPDFDDVLFGKMAVLGILVEIPERYIVYPGP